MPDATKMDLAQNKAIRAVEESSAALEESLARLHGRVANLEAQMQVLAPLGELLNHITQIKRNFGAG